mmetsp:Transcript_8779/g.11903  ORF Transcript_8779/g.11903 Transcript_8779/m.11903 type:complete len:128 (+) Transcript_8779:177-560(+)
MHGVWRLHSAIPSAGHTLQLSVHVTHPTLGLFFTAHLELTRQESVRAPLEQWLGIQPHLTALRIYWHAVKLIWKGVSIQPHPRDTGASPTEYRDTASNTLRETPTKNANGCPAGFVWREASSFPWSF